MVRDAQLRCAAHHEVGEGGANVESACRAMRGCCGNADIVRVRRTIEGRDLAARLLGFLVRGVRRSRGLLQGGEPRGRAVLHRRRRRDLDHRAVGQRRYRAFQRAARRDRRLREGRAGQGDLRADDRRGRALLVRARRERDQEPEGRGRKDGFVFLARLVVEPDFVGAAATGRRQRQDRSRPVARPRRSRR